MYHFCVILFIAWLALCSCCCDNHTVLPGATWGVTEKEWHHKCDLFTNLCMIVDWPSVSFLNHSSMPSPLCMLVSCVCLNKHTDKAIQATCLSLPLYNIRHGHITTPFPGYRGSPPMNHHSRGSCNY